MSIYNYNILIKKNMENVLLKLKGISEKNTLGNEALNNFFSHTANKIQDLYNLKETLTKEYFETKSLEELKALNAELFAEVMPQAYVNSYANPSYAVKVLGEGVGQALSYLYSKVRASIREAFKGDLKGLNLTTEMFLKLYDELSSKEESEEIIQATIKSVLMQNIKEVVKATSFKYHLKNEAFYTDIIFNSDLSDLRYLYKLGEYVSENEIKTATFLNNYDSEKLATLAKATVTAYVNGFKRDNKDITLRKNVSVIYSLGQERLVKEILEELKNNNLEGFIKVVDITEYNKQYGYDHRFDGALVIDKEYINLENEAIKEYAKEQEALLKDYSGILVVETFGEVPFSPENKKECLKLSEEQNKIFTEHRVFTRQLVESYAKETETSFCIIAFPSPEIGDNFEDIFADTCKINMLDSAKYEVIQQKIIDALDKGEFVHVKGSGTNKTDIMVRLHELENPEKQTNFVNCVADVNVPVGEVFTSPVLKDTTGVLHLEETYLGLKYYNLTLNFKDGYVEEYTCSNFDNEEENKKYVEENLLFPHKTLPLGEFAIGTNTLAYVISQKYGIIDKLPVLIIEKMGPHFAIGDTCFSFGEDNPVYNPLDKKEIIARDNEKSILRKTDINSAYTNVHTDITLPYDGLEFIQVITKSGETIDIIRNGRFVLEGTEELNEAFN